MYAFILIALIACDESAPNEIATTQRIIIQELEIAFEDRNGMVQAPDGEIVSASFCYEEQGVLMCTPTSWGINDNGMLVMSMNTDTIGVIKYINITEE